MSKLTTVDVNEHIFEVGRWSQSWLRDNLGAFALDRFELIEQERFEINAKLREFTTQILEHKLVEDSYQVYFNYKVPASWFQHLKQEKAPRWFVKRYPIKLDNKKIKRTVNITRKATYPMADIVVPKNMNRVVIKDIVNPLSFYEEEL